MMMMTMYKKILPFVNRFIYLRQGYFNRFYEGKILEVTPDTLTLQAYDEQGRLDSQWVIALPTITEFMTGDRDLDELNMKVSMAKTIEQAELTELELLSRAGLQQQAVSPCEEPYEAFTVQASLFSATSLPAEVPSGLTAPNKKNIAPTTTGESNPMSLSLKPTALYGSLSETLRSTANYLEETLGFASPQSQSSVTPAEDDQPAV
jgi:hypothetical protein